MFSDNSRISDRQLKKMLVFDMVSISILIIPYIAVTGAGRDGIISILIAGAASLLYGFIMLYFCKQIKCEYMQYCKRVLGKFFTFLFGLLYLIKFFFAAVFILTLFTTVIHETILSNTSSKIILLALISVSVFYASKKMETRARMVEILYYIILIPLLLLFLLGFYKVNPSNLFPLAVTEPIPVIKTGYGVLMTFAAIEFILFATPSISGEDEKSKFKRKVLQAITIISVFNIVVFVIVTGLLGSAGASQNLWSTISVMQMIEIPGNFVHRQDAIMLFFWLTTIFTITSSLFHYLSSVTKSITGINKTYGILITYGVLLFIITMKPLNLDLLFEYFGYYMALIGFPQSIFLPLLVIVIGKIRKGGKPCQD